MNFYIVEGDLSVTNNLGDIIGSHNLGSVCGDSEGKASNLAEIMALNPDVVLADFLVPNMDGTQVVSVLCEMGSTTKYIVISQVSNKELVMRAYNAGVGFSVSRPVNVIGIKQMVENITQQIRMEQMLSNIRKMFQVDMGAAPAAEGDDKDIPVCRLQHILNQSGMFGEKGSKDIITACQYLYDHEKTSIAEKNIDRLREILNDNPKSMEQRIHRVVAKGISGLANLGIEDFMNDIFTWYFNTLLSPGGIKTEMDFIRGKHSSGGKISIKKFTSSLLVFMDQ